MRRRFVLALALAALAPALALAGDGSVDVGRLEGIYRKRMPNGDSAGATYTTTDVLRLVRLDQGAAYFDIALNFFNGHMCALSGIAKAEGGALVYRGATGVGDEICELAIKPARGRIGFADKGQRCRSTCGARGGYDGAWFSIARRQTMSARERRKILAEASDEIEAHKAGTAAKPGH
ncbi:MAG: hypothetical protein ACJ8DK_08860 [Microvirga sp.]